MMTEETSSSSSTRESAPTPPPISFDDYGRDDNLSVSSFGSDNDGHLHRDGSDDSRMHEHDISRGTSLGSTSESGFDTASRASSQGSRRGARFRAALNRETRCLRCSKGLFFLVLVIAASACAFAVYYITIENEQSTYRTRFQDIGTTIIAVSNNNAKSVVEIYETVSQQISIYTESTLFQSTHNGEKWPFVHLPGFEAQSEQIRNITRTSFVTLTTIVLDERLDEYNSWIRQRNPIWIQESLDYVGQPNRSIFSIPFVFVDNADTSLGFRRYDPKDDDNGYSMVVSQIAPIVEVGSYVNYNSLYDKQGLPVVQAMLDQKELILAPTSDLVNASEALISIPASFLNAPIFRSRQDSKKEIVAMLAGSLFWDGFFIDVVPEGIDGIYLIVHNPCSKDHTFLIEGPQVTYVGEGDLHDTSLDGVTKVSNFTAFGTLPGCPFTLKLHPTQDFYDTYHTTRPLTNTLLVAVAFVVTAVMFLMYDCLVERRQNNVMKTADRSNAILSSLFPDNVRDRLMDMNDDGNSGNNNGGIAEESGYANGQGSDIEHGKSRNVSSLVKKVNQLGSKLGYGTVRSGNNNDNETRMRGRHGPHAALTALPTAAHPPSHSRLASADKAPYRIHKIKSKPIADLFPKATVLFADLVGFTAWSSMREPTQVFELLETLYNTFDSFARRLGVFKVETIGDCYVAATGLPEPNRDHAVVMVRFAKTCLSKMKHVMSSLAVSLGPSTRDLTMRFGMHSGPVTAGVLRGEKSRFQLFGDTVNTASRIESSGMPSRIHVSQETADELITAGKLSWLVAREDKVVAKGKGEMQTYWIRTSSWMKGDTADSVVSMGIDTGIDTASVHSRPRSNADNSDSTSRDGRHHDRRQLLSNEQYDKSDSRGNFGDKDDSRTAQETTTSSSASSLQDKLSASSTRTGSASTDNDKAYRSVDAVTVSPIGVPTTLSALSVRDAGTAAAGSASGPRSTKGSESNSILRHGDSNSSHTLRSKQTARAIDADTEYEIQWNVDVIQNMLKKILAMRDPSVAATTIINDKKNNSSGSNVVSDVSKFVRGYTKKPYRQRLPAGETVTTVLDEVKEVITLPNKVAQMYRDPDLIELPAAVQLEVREYVQTIATLYRQNPFHNFSHASHVVQSTSKLMSRIVGSDAIDYKDMTYKKKSGESLHHCTYGITSDPVTQFACIMAALVHDVDHMGVPNAQLVKEGSDLAQRYRNKSVAEQNSLDLAWDLLMQPQFASFRACIYSTQAELDRFRQLMVNAVMATDIMDKELGALRKKRWEKAFAHRTGLDSASIGSCSGSVDNYTISSKSAGNGDKRDGEEYRANRMATIVIEHLIQASDVAHTMQHWHVYVKWNERLFEEMYRAYRDGRADKDPTDGWYEGELGFFDFYIIPLAKKLKECGVFGVLSDEYLLYAQANRKEWEKRGKDLVARYMQKYTGSK